MAAIPIRIYPKSPLATIVSLSGSVMLVLGIGLIFAEGVVGVVFAAIGVGLLIWASSISDAKLFKLWIKDLKSKGVIDQLSSSRELCLQMYQANPSKRTINFIAKYNPVVAEELTAALKK